LANIKNTKGVIMKKVLVLLFAFALIAQAQNWTPVTSGLSGNIWGIDYADANNVWICDGSGVARSTNGGLTWIPAGNAGDGAYSVAAISANTAIVALGPSSGDGKILRTTDGGTTWNQVYTAAGAWFNLVDNISSTDLWAQSDPINGVFHIVKSTDGGVTWALASNLPTQPTNVVGILGSYYRIGNTCWFGTQGTTLANRVYKSTNGPDGPWTFGTTTDQSVNCVAFSSVFGIGLAGMTSAIVNVSYDGGNNWSSQTTSIGGISGLDFVQGTTWVWASNSTGIYKSSNNGTDWSQDLNEVSMLSVRFFGDANVGLAGGTGGKLYKSSLPSVLPVELSSFTAQAENQKVILRWTTVTELNNNGFEIQRRVMESEFVTIGFVRGEGTTTNQKEYSYVDKDIIGAKYFYRLKQIDYNGNYEYSDVIEIDAFSIDEYALEQNFPNPFNPSTKIKYSIPYSSLVTLKVFDALGNKIETLVNEEKPSGSYEVNFNASSLTSGVYFYRLQDGSFVETKKMILIK